jgi:hypothetical protein
MRVLGTEAVQVKTLNFIFAFMYRYFIYFIWR